MRQLIKITSLSLLAWGLLSLSPAMAKELNPQNPEGYKQFRMDYDKMVELANPKRLSHRIFYQKPSEGPDAKWFDAVKQGDLETIKDMVANGQNIEAKDEAALGQTALGWAAFIGYEDIVDYLLAQNASLLATDRGDVYNVLKSSVLGGKNLNIFKKLYARMKDQVDINDQTHDSQGETFLIVAASNDRRELVELLLSMGANPNLVTTVQDKHDVVYDQSALSFACDQQLPEMVALLIKHGAINQRTGKSSCQ